MKALLNPSSGIGAANDGRANLGAPLSSEDKKHNAWGLEKLGKFGRSRLLRKFALKSITP